MSSEPSYLLFTIIHGCQGSQTCLPAGKRCSLSMGAVRTERDLGWCGIQKRAPLIGLRQSWDCCRGGVEDGDSLWSQGVRKERSGHIMRGYKKDVIFSVSNQNYRNSLHFLFLQKVTSDRLSERDLLLHSHLPDH